MNGLCVFCKQVLVDTSATADEQLKQARGIEAIDDGHNFYAHTVCPDTRPVELGAVLDPEDIKD